MMAFWIGLPLVLGATGIPLIRLGLGRVRAGLARRSWPRATGRVADSEIVQDGEGRRAIFVARIEYEYEVNGKSYPGVHGIVSKTRTTLEREIAPYPASAPIEIFYAPAEPHRSSPSAGPELADWSIAAGGFVILLTGLIIFIFPIVDTGRWLPF